MELDMFSTLGVKPSDVREYSYGEFVTAVNRLVARFEQALQVDSGIAYQVTLQTHVRYTSYYPKLARNPAAADFPGCALRPDLPPTEESDLANEHFYFTKEMTFGRHLIRMDCEVLQEDLSPDDSDGYDSDESALVSYCQT